MAKKISDVTARSSKPPHLTTSDKGSPMAAQLYNGPDKNPISSVGVVNREPKISEAPKISEVVAEEPEFFPDPVMTFIKKHWKYLISIAIAAGALWLLPVTRFQLDNVKTEITGKIDLVAQKVADHDEAIKQTGQAVLRIESKIDHVVEKLIPAPVAAGAPAAAVPPLPHKIKKPSPQRRSFFDRLGR